jgi:hypothetical protein
VGCDGGGTTPEQLFAIDEPAPVKRQQEHAAIARSRSLPEESRERLGILEEDGDLVDQVIAVEPEQKLDVS